MASATLLAVGAGTSTALPPLVSRRLGMSAATTGRPFPCASATGRPKPSELDGKSRPLPRCGPTFQNLAGKASAGELYGGADGQPDALVVGLPGIAMIRSPA